MKRVSRTLILTVAAFALLLDPAASAQSAPQPAPQGAAQNAAPPAPQKETRLKLAEGEYRVQFTFDGADLYLKDAWTLWLTSEGTYEVDETAEMTADGLAMRLKQVLVMTQDFRPISSRFQIQLPQDGTPVAFSGTMEFDASEFRLQAAGRTLRVKATSPYEVLIPWPWFLSSTALRARENGNRDTQVRFLILDENCSEDYSDETEDEPGDAEEELEDCGEHESAGQVRFLGRGFVHIRGTTWEADKYQIDIGSDLPSIILWLSAEGIPLAMEDSKKSEQRMELLRYKKFRDFAPAALAPES